MANPWVTAGRVQAGAEAFTVTGLTNGVTYEFQALTVDTSGNKSTGGTIVEATPIAITPTVEVGFVDTTPRTRLQLLYEGQAFEDVVMNENHFVLDLLANLYVIDHDLTDQPASPTDGDCYWLPMSPAATGDTWDGLAEVLVFYFGGWRALVPFVGLPAWFGSLGLLAVWSGSAWKKYDGTDWSTDAF